MTRPSRAKQYRRQAAATARAAKAPKKKTSINLFNDLDIESKITEYTTGSSKETSRTVSDGAEASLLLDSSSDECGWDGTVNHIPNSKSHNDNDSLVLGSSSTTDTESDIEVSDMEGEELLKSLGSRLERELELLTTLTPYEKIQDGESGLGAKDAQFEVRAFSSRIYKSHRRIPTTLCTKT